MLNDTQVREVIGATAYDTEGNKIGKVGQLFLDDETGQPEFVTVNTGFFGTGESFVPVQDATYDGDRLTLPYTKDKIKDAPRVDLDGRHLDQEEERRLYEYYDRGYTDYYGTGDGSGVDRTVGAGTTTGTTTDYDTTTEAGRGVVGNDTSGPETDTAMTRSEEHLEAGTVEEEAGRVRLRKYVTTETESETVPVQKERAVVEREPVTGSNVDEALDGPAISEEEHEVVLHEERAVADTVAEPVERVRLDKEVVQEQETVSGEVRKEHIETEGDVDERRR